MKVGILGLGSAGMRHAKNIQELGHEVLGYDPKIANGVSRDKALVESDAIVIATPIASHYQDIVDALAHNKPILCEKPIADAYNAQFNRVKMVGYNLRFHPAAMAAKAWINEIGDPLWANFTCGQLNKKYTDPLILNWSHEIDLALHLLGSGRVVSASSFKDIADINIVHDNGCVTSVHLDYVSEPEVRQFIIQGSKGQLIGDILNRQLWLRDKDGIIRTSDDPNGSFDEDYQELIRAFLDGEYEQGASGSEGLAALQICLDAMGKEA